VIDCPVCHGDGTVTVNPAYPDPQGAIDVRCDACDGTGMACGCAFPLIRVEDDLSRCARCGGGVESDDAVKARLGLA
jgi:DnaJ-class molecular chaperone